jgi:hypothetical protein
VLELLTPSGFLIALAAALPLALMARRRGSDERVRQALGLALPSRSRRHGPVAATALLFVLLGAAAAQPVLFVDDVVETRRDAEAYVVVDASRSMLAAAAPGAPTRFERAIRLARELRPALPDVPVGVASVTDRPLPHLFPSADAGAFDAVVTRALGIERPPPQEPGRYRATSFASLAFVARTNFFSAASTHRLAILLTDGESQPFDADELRAELGREGIGLVVVRFWNEDERVFDARGRPEAYRPDPSSASLAGLASIGARVLPEGDPDAVARVARDVLGTGPAVEVARERRAVALAPWIALSACIPLTLLLLRRAGDTSPRRARPGSRTGAAPEPNRSS